ncbi:toxin glutamine deamidase domain-containing protein [Gilliamella sp. B3801]|uniref:toxin glutamine deamidase domain-containing protein n=1 Tax=Gilliamella sp. B3801 TaxID=2817997 RepID=UPI00226AD6E8|nr:toxin glutamine deamidase domain-containing protein [Gilliamella sp. B3801]MCX8589010.1 hypothetical protein [Gilliamella sp. B3801]
MGQSTLDLLWDSTLINPVSPLFFARVHAEIISDKPIGQAPNPIQMPEVSPPQTISGGITHGVSQFIVGFIPAVRATKFIKPLKNVGSWVKGMIAGSVTDFTVFSPHEERLSNLVQEFPELANPITEYLQAKPDDSFAEGRLKNSLEGIIAGGLAEPLTRSLRLLKYARIKITGTEVRAKVHHKIETVTVELDEVNWNNVAEKVETSSILNDTAGSIRDVNPGYPTEGRTHNCVNCAIATDATLGGNPASALPINSKNGVSISVLEKQYGTKFQNVSGPNNIIEQMSNAGTGARGIVFGSYGPGQPGHVFNVVNQNGKIRFLDGQTGKAADMSKFKSFKFLRTN